ncbi:hypothetical protein CYMTET_39510 [Cymbomonas tetramitiformis]|uniref:CS domain-containing protein n=1 Tax=Cymbomonas tetramitiformis TaxID=36881 RepID=A0AAE0CC55_9CHLO|nr:hypothetical protein CYMTET_39512 [Cymbomonas tetramitiformis]KAK3251144.1 hypothetical protein CYMTET_39510 [Cymbomonas tetramitiformis]
MSNYRVIKTPQDVTVVIDIPGAVAASDICVELLDSNTLSIAVPSLGGYLLTIPLPLSTSQDGCTVRFKKKSRQLSVKLVDVEQTLAASGAETTEYAGEKSREAQGLSDCSTTERSAIATAEQSYAAAQAVCDTSVAASAFTSVAALTDAKYGARKSSARSQAVKSLAAALEKRGWAVCDDFVQPSRVIEIREELERLQRAGLYDTGRVGPSGTGRHEMATLRGDKVLWLDAAGLAAHPNLRVLAQEMDELIEKELCGRVARLQHLEGRTDAMLTNYPGNGAR